MDQSALYDEDIHAWSQHQAKVLRGLAAAGLRLPNDLDLEHVAEEIEEVGNEQRFGAECNLLQALVHLAKVVALPENQAVKHWTKEANAFLDNAERRYRPSMKHAIDLEGLWARARRLASKDLEIDGNAVPPLPDGCPFELGELVSGEPDPRDLAARLSALVEAQRASPDARRPGA